MFASFSSDQRVSSCRRTRPRRASLGLALQRESSVVVEMGKMAQRLTLFTAVSFALPEVVKGNEAAAYQVLHEMRSVEHESSKTP
jgi:hypothetical protein